MRNELARPLLLEAVNCILYAAVAGHHATAAVAASGQPRLVAVNDQIRDFQFRIRTV